MGIAVQFCPFEDGFRHFDGRCTKEQGPLSDMCAKNCHRWVSGCDEVTPDQWRVTWCNTMVNRCGLTEQGAAPTTP